MNDWDRQNIEFILRLVKNPNELVAWFNTVKESCDDEEIEYALDMLFAARNQIEMELLELYDDEAEEDVSMAADYLQRFRLH